jgi:PAS domain S-box-containing protein
MATNPTRDDHFHKAKFIEDREALKRVETQLLAAIVKSSLDAIISKTPDGIITSWNEAAKKLYGYTAEEVIGHHVGIIVPPERADELQEILQRLETYEGTQRLETERLTKQGERLEVEVRISPIRDAEGQLVGASSIAHDIGERKRISRTLAQTAENLVKSNVDLEQFAYVASHDLQEPLRMVASYVQLIAQRYKGRLDADADEFINFAVDGASRMKTLIRDLLAYSHAGHGEDFGKMNTRVALDDALANLQFTIRETGALITHDEMPEVIGIPPQIAELFQNLIGNAVKFHSEQNPRIHVSSRRVDTGWEIAVNDNGIGIAPEHKEKVFEIFCRLHGRGKYPGTGIGLAICRKIVIHHGGEISVDSIEGHGATFRFTLPDDTRSESNIAPQPSHH